MPNLCDYIEEYLIEQIRRSRTGIVEIQRNDLAERFRCVPSQINYVLETRFSTERGFMVESRRGGGGFIRIIRLNLDSSDQLYQLIHERIGNAISQDEATGYILHLSEQGFISAREAALMQAALGRDVLAVELPLRDHLRAKVLKAMLLALLRAEAAGTANKTAADQGVTPKEVGP